MAGLSLPLLCGLLIVVTMTAGQSGPPSPPGYNRRWSRTLGSMGLQQPPPVMPTGAGDWDEEQIFSVGPNDESDPDDKEGSSDMDGTDYEDDDCYMGKEDDTSEYIDYEDGRDWGKAKGGDDWGRMGMMGPGWMKKMGGEDGGEKEMRMMEMRNMYAEMVSMTRLMRMFTGGMFGFGMGPGMFGGGMGGMGGMGPGMFGGGMGGMGGMGGKGHKGGKGGKGKWDKPRRRPQRKPCPKPRELPSICSVAEKATSKNIFNRTCPEDHVCIMASNVTRCSNVSIKVCLHKECLNKSQFDSKKCMDDKLEKARKMFNKKMTMIEEEQEDGDINDENAKELEKLKYSVAHMAPDEPKLVLKYISCLIPKIKKM